MNKYEIRVGNAVMITEALNEWSAMKALCIFKEIGNMIDFVRTAADPSKNFAWIYQVELNGQSSVTGGRC